MEHASGAGAVVAIFWMAVYDTMSTTNSSPQTTEINAKARADTLMKWVNIGLAQSAFIVILGASIEKQRGNAAWPPLLGGGLAGALLWIQYNHAKTAGLESEEPGTETY